jgi:hypothetical protein
MPCRSIGWIPQKFMGSRLPCASTRYTVVTRCTTCALTTDALSCISGRPVNSVVLVSGCDVKVVHFF